MWFIGTVDDDSVLTQIQYGEVNSMWCAVRYDADPRMWKNGPELKGSIHTGEFSYIDPFQCSQRVRIWRTSNDVGKNLLADHARRFSAIDSHS